MVRQSAPFWPLAPDGSGAPPRFGDPVVLVRAPYRVSLSYAGPDRVWRGSWGDVPTLPTAVRVLLRDAGTSQTLAVSTAATVHVNLSAECAHAQNVTACSLGKTVVQENTPDLGPAAGRNPPRSIGP
jgi:general secretion pathway protein J